MISFLLPSDHHYLRHEDTRDIRIAIVCESQYDQSVLFVVYSALEFTCVACTVYSDNSTGVQCRLHRLLHQNQLSPEISPRLLALSPSVAVLQ